jgi:hypothetical protein
VKESRDARRQRVMFERIRADLRKMERLQEDTAERLWWVEALREIRALPEAKRG